MMRRAFSSRAFCSSSGDIHRQAADIRTAIKDLTSEVKTLNDKISKLDTRTVEMTGALETKLVEMTGALETKLVERVGAVTALVETVNGKLTAEFAQINATLKTSVAVLTGLISFVGLGFASMRYFDTKELKKELEKKDFALKQVEARRQRALNKRHARQQQQAVGGASAGTPP